MRKNLFLLAFAILAFGSDRLIAQTGGPDLFGYIWKDSNAPGGPAFVWKDISTIGTNITPGMTDDNAVGPYNLGWTFHYYWAGYDKVKVGSNGWISFKTTVGNIAHCFPTIPSAGGTADNYLAPFMTDLTFNANGNAGKVYYWSNNIDTFIVSYNNVPWWTQAGPGFAGNNSFQMVLSGRDSSITYYYQNLDAANFNDQPGCASDIVIGIENLTGNIGLEHSVDAACVANTTNYAVKFYYPSNTSFQIQDITPLWAGNVENQGQFVLLNEPTILQTGIRNVGNTDVTASITARGKLRDVALNNLNPDFDQTLTIPTGIASSVTNILDYAPYTFNTGGSYTLEVTTTTASGQDANPSNNSNKVEITTVLVGAPPSCAHTYSYASGNPPDGVIAWGGGNGGAGIKVVPPAYPVVIESVDAFMLNGLDTVHSPLLYGATIEIWSENPTTGLPMAMLTSETIAANNTTNFAWNTITLSSPQTITSGGFFVAWLTGGDTVLLGTESLDPISRRTWEILQQGSWAPYRLLTQEDFLIKVNATGCISSKETELNSTFSLELYPNPTNGITTVAYELAGNTNPSFMLTNVQGQTVLSKEFGKLSSGSHAFTIDTQNLAPGIYILNMNVNGQAANRKLVVTK